MELLAKPIEDTSVSEREELKALLLAKIREIDAKQVEDKQVEDKKEKAEEDLVKARKYNPTRNKELKQKIKEFNGIKKEFELNFSIKGKLTVSVEIEPHNFSFNVTEDESEEDFDVTQLLDFTTDITDVVSKPDIFELNDENINPDKLFDVEILNKELIKPYFKLKRDVITFQEEIQDLNLDVSILDVLELK